jgi:hypothetical protein
MADRSPVASRQHGGRQGPRGDPLIRELKLVGFAILLAAIFLGAHAAGSRLGPVTTSHTQVSYPGQGGSQGATMNMGGGGR